MNATEGNHSMGLRLFRKHELQDPPGTKGICGSNSGAREVFPAGLTGPGESLGGPSVDSISGAGEGVVG